MFIIDALAEALVKWFKPNYFVWIGVFSPFPLAPHLPSGTDPIKCKSCQGSTESIGMAEPTQDDLLGGAGRVEQHKCLDPGCGTIVRFPRYK